MRKTLCSWRTENAWIWQRHTQVGGLSFSPGTAYVCIKESEATVGGGNISSLLLPCICCWHKVSRLYCHLVPRIGPYRSNWVDHRPQLQCYFMSFFLVVGFVLSVGTWGSFGCSWAEVFHGHPSGNCSDRYTMVLTSLALPAFFLMPQIHPWIQSCPYPWLRLNYTRHR